MYDVNIFDKIGSSYKEANLQYLTTGVLQQPLVSLMAWSTPTRLLVLHCLA